MHKIFKYMCVSIAMLPLLAAQAYAEDCTNLSKNSDWVDGMNAITGLYSSGSYDAVLDTGKYLMGICSKSPTLNYILAKAYHEKGESQKELFYLQQATRNSQYMEVKADDLEKMWKDRIYLEYPDISPKSVEQLKLENEQLKSQMMSNSINAISGNSSSISNYKVMMWTGVGVSGAGLAMLITGAALVAAQKDNGVEFNVNDDSIEARAKGTYIAGWTTLGLGIATTVVGAAFAGISGYFLSKAKKEESISFGVSPVSASMTVQF